MEVKLIRENKKQFLDLLLIADEQESMIDRYLERGELFALYGGELIAVCVVTREDDETLELKNIAVYENWQGQGYGSKLISCIVNHYRGRAKRMIVGTGDTPQIIGFYEKNGFVISHRVENFFTDNYDHPIIDNGVLLKDMVYLSREI